MNEEDVVVRKLEQESPDDPEWMFWCPGCKCGHWFKTTGKEPRWTFNGDQYKPTVRASILVRYSHWVPPYTPENPVKKEDQTQQHDVCHLFVTDGKIEYLSDCTHALAGQTIEMKPF